MKNLLLLLVVAAAGFLGWRYFQQKRKAPPIKNDPRSLQANKKAAPVKSDLDFMKDKLLVDTVSNLPTIVAGLAPSRWFNSQDTREVYEANSRGENVSAAGAPDDDEVASDVEDSFPL